MARIIIRFKGVIIAAGTATSKADAKSKFGSKLDVEVYQTADDFKLVYPQVTDVEALKIWEMLD